MEVKSVFSDRCNAYKWIKEFSFDISKFINMLSYKTDQFEHVVQPAQGWDSLVTNDMHEAIEKLGLILATFNTWYDGEIGADSEEAILKELYSKKND